MGQRVSKFIAFIPMLAVFAFPALSSAQTLLNGAGATFPNPIYQKWFSEYHKAHPDVQINYQSIGSGGGIKQITEGTVDFGASDGPMNDQQVAEFKTKRGNGILHFPTVLGAVVPVYNVPGLPASGFNFTGDALAGIFLGKITKWNDPALAKVNPKVKLPDADIIVVHRSEGSGTTYCWTDYLAKISPEWKAKVGTGGSVNWPSGIGGKGNDGVSGQVKNTANSIGYVELIYAEQNKIPFGNVKNAAGVFVKADLASITAAAAGAAKSMPEDFRVSITNAPGNAAYPISTFTWLLIPEEFKDQAKSKILKDFVKWALTAGQSMAEPLSYARLPKEVVVREEKALARIK
jgi:phosphate transport system substrate-binding protein